MANTADMEKQPLLEAQRREQALANPEPTLAELQQDVFKAQRRYMQAWSRSTNGRLQKRIMLAVTAILLFFMVFCMSVIVEDAMTEDGDWTFSGKVPLEAHIMSKCPDAKDCLHDMILPAMQNVSNKVDFKLSYIGTSDNNDTVHCKHGQPECLGNIIELCAAQAYPDPKVYLGFTMCLTQQYSDIPKRELVEDCALEHGISMEKINECATLDDEGDAVGLLRESFERSAEAGASRSCTVRLAGEVRCVRDGGEWVDCEGGSGAGDLVRDVEAEWEKRWREY